ncbi:MAG: tRNA (adenosine(37)-N6)-dimethylallyltransferase MiaA [Nitrospirae bacterium]|nr:tRNA (adenosine(37)-N6)-dimethylallyltransferase MiaA [Nitrospirota bacterium]
MNKVIILLGPTGVGKSVVSILLAKSLNTEIISADSMQIYRYMDIGTAKPSKEERAIVKHHMIDIIDPSEAYSTGKYIRAVVPIIEELHRDRKIPIVVGGTGLYIKAMTRGIFSGPSADWSLREELLLMEEEEKGSLYNYLKEFDPEAAEKITPNDTRRIIRALEVCLKSDTSMSEIQKKLTTPFPYEFIKIGLLRDRKELYRMIEQRVDKMVEEGLIDEVKKLTETLKDAETRRHGDIHPFTASYFPAMQAIGYKEIAMYLNGEITLAEAIRLIKRGTKRYAKRQFTWFKKEEGIHWIDITGIYDSHEILLRIYSVLNRLM